MHHKLRLAAAALAAGLLLSSCTGFDTTSLMRPPRLTAEQRAIDEALRAAVDGTPVLKYPKSGDYRSAFVFHDIDGDGQEEALAFYATEANEYARVVLLDQIEDRWISPCDLPGADQDVEFISFANVTGGKTEDVVIGWSNPGDADMTLGVYSYRDGLLVKALADSDDNIYNDYLINDIEGDGLSDIFLLTRNSATSEKASWLRRISFDGYTLGKVDEMRLSDAITKFAGVTVGRLSKQEKLPGIFVDEVLTGDMLVTEVFTVRGGSMAAVIWQDMPAPEQTEPAEPSALQAPLSLYEQTRRADTATVCADVNGDKVIEIPASRLLPGYDDSDRFEGERIYLTEYRQLNGGALTHVFAAAINRTGGYRVAFPPEWIDKVTIVEQSENGEWLFFKYNDSLDDVSGELARVRVVSPKDYQDKFLESYVVMRTRGLFTYYGYVPPVAAGNPLAVTAEELSTKLFSLL